MTDGKLLNIELKMTVEEVKRLSEMCFHVAEEAHDGPNTEPWHSEEWWVNLGNDLRRQMNL